MQILMFGFYSQFTWRPSTECKAVGLPIASRLYIIELKENENDVKCCAGGTCEVLDEQMLCFYNKTEEHGSNWMMSSVQTVRLPRPTTSWVNHLRKD